VQSSPAVQGSIVELLVRVQQGSPAPPQLWHVPLTVDELAMQVVPGAEHHGVPTGLPQHGWPRPPHAPQDPAPHAAVPPSGTEPAGHEVPATMQIAAAVPVCTQQPPSRQRLAAQQGWDGPPHRPQIAEVVTQVVSGSEQPRTVEGAMAGQQVRPAAPQPSQLPALQVP
jgi:hypothetical protein